MATRGSDGWLNRYLMSLWSCEYTLWSDQATNGSGHSVRIRIKTLSSEGGNVLEWLPALSI